MESLKGEDLAGEDERFRAFLLAHGWDGEMGEEDLKGAAGEGVPVEMIEEEAVKS